VRRRRPRVQAETLSVSESELKGGARRVLRDLLVVVAILGAAGIAFGVWYLSSRHTLHNDRLLGGPQVDVSHAPQIQSETTIAIDPLNPRDLLAGSNDELFITRVYTSRDGGARWRSLGGPPLASRAQCGFGDPTIAMSADGSEYYAFLANLSCNQPEFRSHLFVAARTRFGGEWHTVAVARPGGPRFLWDDKPAIAVDDGAWSPHRGRVYLSWSRRMNGFFGTALETSYSADDGRTWSTPVLSAPIGSRL
jgi:hypothetical protein